MSAEPKVLLEFGDNMRIVEEADGERLVQVAIWQGGIKPDAWVRTLPRGRSAIEVYDALEARHARVREALMAFDRLSLVIEAAIRSDECSAEKPTSPNYEAALEAIRMGRAALETK